MTSEGDITSRISPPFSFVTGFPASLRRHSPSLCPSDSLKLRVWRRVPIHCSSVSPSSSSSGEPTVWKRVRTALPLSRVFKDHLGEDSLQRVNDQKYKVVCPFHNDKNPSLNIDDSLGVFHCFGCGAKGTIIDFEQLISGHRSISTALKSLAGKYPAIAGILKISPPEASTPSIVCDDIKESGTFQSPPAVREPRHVRLTQTAIAQDVLRKLALAYESCLWDGRTPDGLNYLHKVRKFSLATLRAFGCGFALDSPRSNFALSILQDAGHPPEHAVLAGVARVLKDDDHDNPPKYYDVFRNRIVTPIRNLKGETVAFAGRVLPGSSPRDAKYINSPATVLFKKQNLLFGADLAKRSPSAKAECGYVIILEGYLDVISLFDHTQGRVACVAAMGSSLSVDQLQIAYDLLEDEVDGRIIINFDGDDAGKKAAQRLCDSVIPNLFEVAHAIHIAAPPPPVKDVDEFLSSVGRADEYVTYLLDSALPWYEWRGHNIVQDELGRLKNEDSIDIEIPAKSEEGLNEFGEYAVNYRFALADYMRQQQDEVMVAFGAPPESLSQEPATRKIHPRCSEEVLDRLADIVDKAHRVLPGLNVPALVHSWSDLLSRSNPTELLRLYQKLMKRIEERSKSWHHLSLETQLHWMPPPPWLLDELPPWRRKEVSEAAGYLPSGLDDDLDKFLANKTRAKRSLEKINYQAKHVIPILKENQCEQVKRLRIAPRRAAEEIVLRSLIFASETDRIDALAEVLDVIIRCQKKSLPFWTSDTRLQLFEYLAIVEGPVLPTEIAAYVEEFEWFSEEIEELFVPLSEVSDVEWKSIRRLEISSPVKAAKNAALSVEEMSRRVKSRLAIDKVKDNMEELLAVKTTEFDSTGAGKDGRLKDDLLAEQAALRRQIDQTEFMSEKEQKSLQDEIEETAASAKWDLEVKQLVGQLRRKQKIEVPDWIVAAESSTSDGISNESDENITENFVIDPANL